MKSLFIGFAAGFAIILAMIIFMPFQVEAEQPVQNLSGEALEILQESPRFQDSETGRYYYLQTRTGHSYWKNGEFRG